MHSSHDHDSSKKSFSKLSLDFFLKGHQHQSQNIKVLTLWPEIVGEQIARVTRARKVNDDTLIVDVKEQAWQIELSYQTPEILKKYIHYFKQNTRSRNTDLFKIKKIYFKYDPHFKPAHSNPYQTATDTNTDEPSDELLIFSSTPTTVPPNLPNQPKNISNTDFKTSLDETISRLKALWEAQQETKVTTSKIDTEKITPTPATEPPKKISPHHQDRERLYSTEKMNSNFLFSQDEFQSFDLY